MHPRVWAEYERPARLAALGVEPRLRQRQAFTDQPPARFDALGLGRERVYELSASPRPPPPCEPVDEVPRGAWMIDSTGVNKPERVRDGDPRTAWLTQIPQRPGDRVEVEPRWAVPELRLFRDCRASQ